jgi:pimeloyl-ACP methyl ester carboxylesterase
MERLVLVHGSVFGGQSTWRAQRPLAGRYELVVVERPGFPDGPPDRRIEFGRHADWLAAQLRPGSHLVGYSYGGVVCLLAAARRPEAVRSLAVLEPPATRVASGVPAVDRFAADAERWWREGPRHDPEAFLRGFLARVGAGFDPPSPLPARLEHGARALVRERGPWEADVPLDELAAAGFPVLVVSGGHHEAFEAICDVLEERLGAERAVLRGAGHSPQAVEGFNDVLADFVDRAAAAAATGRRAEPAK